MSTPHLITASAAAARLNRDRRTICTHAAALGLGMRAGDSPFAPLLLSESDIEAISARISEISGGHKFKSGNDLHLLRKKPGRKKRETG